VKLSINLAVDLLIQSELAFTESNQTETKYLSSLKISALNVRGVFTSQHDLKHMIATNTPDIMVLTETKL